jgi:hypothetical protein
MPMLQGGCHPRGTMMGDKDSSRAGRVRSAGTRKTAFMAVFVAATFGLMALLSVPSGFLRLPLRLPPPIRGALNPFEPVIPPILGGGKQPKMPRSQGLFGAGLRESPVAAASRPGPIPRPPVPGTKGPIPPPPVPAIDHRRAGGGQNFEPDGRERHRNHRAAHRHRHRHHPRRCQEQKLHHPVEHDRVIRKAARPVHPHGRGGPGRREARAR